MKLEEQGQKEERLMLRLFLLDVDVFGGHNLHLPTKYCQHVTMVVCYKKQDLLCLFVAAGCK